MKKIIPFLFCLFIFSCKRDVEPIPSIDASEVTVLWGKMTLNVMYKLPGNTPTYASRALGYAGLTMYESVVNGSANQKSLVGQLTDLKTLPKPEPNQIYNWVIVLNAGQARILKQLFTFADNSRLAKIDSLELGVRRLFFDKEAPSVIDRSVAYGNAVADAIFEWSKTDGGHEGYLRNFDKTYAFPVGASYWIAPLKGQVVSPYPLHPHWGRNRTFLPADVLPVPAIIPYSQDPNSAYYKEFMAVYQQSRTLNLTQDKKEIAAWWADDPTEVFSPPGHSYSMANIAVKKNPIDLFKAAEVYARTGMAVADAFINCWKTKYTYHGERPSTYIKTTIDSSWTQFWPEPPFPAFSSGHATQAAAAATAMEGVFGKSFAFLDNSHQGRARDSARNIDYNVRNYSSLWAAAEEAALSRFYGGIHTNQDNNTGLQEGRKIGENINNLLWKK